MGTLAPGQRLQEGALAAKFGISKTPVREALARLAHEGLVEVYPRIGYAVTQLGAEEIEDLFEFRKILEGAAAELAARHVTESELERLELVVDTDYIPVDKSSYLDFFSQNREFHFLIARASRNRYLFRAIQTMFDLVDGALRHRLDAGEAAGRMRREHRVVLDALKRRDAQDARIATEDSIVESKKGIIRWLTREKLTRTSGPSS